MPDPDALPISMLISPDGAALDEVVRDAVLGKTTLVRVAAEGPAVRFQFTSDALVMIARGITPGPTDLLGAVLGPYCNRCRYATTATEFSEWTTSERREETMAAACSRCGFAFGESGRSSAELREVAFRSLGVAYRR